MKEGTFLHLLEKSRALWDRYFRRYELFNLFLFFHIFSKIFIFHQSQFWAVSNNKNEFSKGQREGGGGREGEGGQEKDGRSGREGGTGFFIDLNFGP